ncbi:hypothetical protein L486_05350 [Kwoniella mangroviensis CBS 10435]|uniref:Uncharacterized protein n=1 Tax=Kwoniella mangroviensis CBS 10435 TaxID=1331196 RepID=A0A1B9IMB7_9TREE|nr:hypothetical protein L486_05350 [Kwoniella mangroviensis CBS 10435]
MVFQSHTNYLSAQIQVRLENEGVIDMLGGPNTGTSYSLPGHIIISLPALPAPMEGRLREVKDLKIVMEGKSEFWDDHGRYTPMRLYSTTLILATPSKPLLLPSHDPNRAYAQRIQLAVAFDMRLPGWLPPSHDSEMTTISYGLIAHSTIGWTEPATTFYASPSTCSSSFSSSSSSSSSDSDVSMESIIPIRPMIMKPKSSKPFEYIFGNHSLLAKSIEKSSSKWTPFTVQRHRMPSAVVPYPQGATERHFTLRPESDSTSPVECVVTVPDWVDVNGEEKSLKVSLRVRARKPVAEPMEVDTPEASSNGSASTLNSSSSTADEEGSVSGGGSRELESVPMERSSGKGKKAGSDLSTYILELGMEVEETERYSSTPSQSFTSSFPLPSEQPTRNSSVNQLISPRMGYADGTGSFLGYDERPFKGMRTRQCLLSDDGNQRNFFFADKGLGLGDKWRKVNVILPMPSLESGKGLSTRPQPELDGPFLRIRHDLKIRVVCRSPGSKDDTQVVILSTPIKFGTCPSTMPSIKDKPTPLPAYIQLFHENDDLRECDSLPVYTGSSSSSSSDSNSSATEVPVPDTPAPSYASLYPLTTRPCSSRSPSPSSYDDSASVASSSGSSTLGRRERSSSPSPSSSEDEPESMDIDSVISSSDEDDGVGNNNGRTRSTNGGVQVQSRKVARTIPRGIRTAA